MPTTTRRPHTKSRHGCQQCKKNRTKCDEQKPSCSRCVRTGAKCSLLDPSSALIIINDKTTQALSQATNSEAPASAPTDPVPVMPGFTSSPLVSPSSSQADGTPESSKSAPLVVDGGPSIAESEVDRLRLLHHYSQSTADSIAELTGRSLEGQNLWRVSIPELAFKHEYVLHGLLSISALHMTLLDPSTDHINGVLAVQHHISGIKLFTPLLQNITVENIEALFTFACLTSLYSYGIHLRKDIELSPLNKIHEVFLMFRGSSTIVHTGRQWLAEGIWGPWFGVVARHRSSVVPDEIEAVIKQLQSRVNSTITTTANSEMYFQVIGLLRENFQQARGEPRTQLAINLLPILAPPNFLQMVCIGEPLALSILANWAVILHWFREYIWVQNWGAKIIEAVQEVLLPEWHECIQWAIQQRDNHQTLHGLLTPGET